VSVFLQFGGGEGHPTADPAQWGGKGAGLARMAVKGYPVPPGFVISTEMCKIYQDQPEAVMEAIMLDIDEHLEFIKAQFGYMPLLSVRSGAPISMPGMMDTILNVGMRPDVMKEWFERIGERATFDSYRRLLQMMGTTALNLDHAKFEEVLTTFRENAGAETDAELTVKDLKGIVNEYRLIYNVAGAVIPTGLDTQLGVCIDAVFKSWMNPRAIDYRRIEGIDDSIGTAVTVQAMVFGNMNDNSGSGVLFTRNPSTGELRMMAEYLANAQGEDVVAGIRTPDSLELPVPLGTKEKWKIELFDLAKKLELDYRDMVDAEFTVQDGELFILQSRVGKRSAQAAFHIALSMRAEGIISRDEMFDRVKRKHLRALLRPAIDPTFKAKPVWTGLPASMGIATGQVWKSSKMAVAMSEKGPVILVTEETTPDDIMGMAASVGILTRTGGATSHAAVVARSMDKPCVVGCIDLNLTDLPEGTVISIDGETGRVWLDAVPVVGGQLTPAAEALINELMETRQVIARVKEPRVGAVIMLADWLDWKDDKIDKALKQCQKIDSAGEELVFDITPPYQFGDEADQEIWNIAGGVLPEEERFIERVISRVLHSGMKKAKITGGNVSMASMFAMKEFEQVPMVGSFEELLHATGMVGVTQELAQVISPTGKMFDVINKLREAGLFSGRVSTSSLPPAYAAFELLGE
jgi:pyruvate,orthophosphate dikinase